MLRVSLILSVAFAVVVAAGGRAAADEIFLKDGSHVIGKVVSMTEGKLKVMTAFAKEVEIDWAQVAGLVTDEPLAVVLTDNTVLKGQVARTPDGGFSVKTPDLANPIPVPQATITAINPPVKPAMTFKGYLAAAATVNDGNTNNRSASLSAEFEARSERQRFTMYGIYNYADDNSHNLTARNARGQMKYDFFITKRIYFFASALFENDKFQDLRLRTALAAGPGFQIIDKGTFEKPWLRELEVNAEAGLGYFDEDYKYSEDKNYLTARWALRANWPISPDKIIIFHRHEGFPGLEDASDLYILTEQGVRFSILKNLFAAFQINWRWDNTPADGRERSDTTFLLSIGYNFDLTS
jgi:putative salt-induced outer membrane protein YdiY